MPSRLRGAHDANTREVRDIKVYFTLFLFKLKRTKKNELEYFESLKFCKVIFKRVFDVVTDCRGMKVCISSSLKKYIEFSSFFYKQLENYNFWIICCCSK